MISKKIGFAGLGNIGKAMATNIVKRGYELSVFDIRREPMEELGALGAKVVTSPKILAEVSQFIISMVRDTDQTMEVVFGEEGLWRGISPGAVLIIMSTIDPQCVREIWAKGKEKGVAVIDAPVSGGPMGAARGDLTIMVGGEEKVYRECLPLLEAMGKSIFYIGDTGSGLVTKLVNNLIYGIILLGTFEGLKLAGKAGVNQERLVEVLKISTGRSWAVDNWDHVLRRIQEHRENPRTSGFQLVYKDIGLALNLAKTFEVKLPLLALAAQLEFGD